MHLLDAGHPAKCFTFNILFSLHNNLEIRIFSISKKKPKSRRVKWPIQSHTTSKWPGQGSKPNPMSLSTLQYILPRMQHKIQHIL